MDSQYKLLSELLSDQAVFITSPKTSLANYWGGIAPLPPVSTGLAKPACFSAKDEWNSSMALARFTFQKDRISHVLFAVTLTIKWSRIKTKQSIKTIKETFFRIMKNLVSYA